MKKYYIQFAILLFSLVSVQTVFADVKVKARQNMGDGKSYEYTTYIKGKRQRDERDMGGMQTVSITQCDLKRSVQMMPAAQSYMVTTYTVEPEAATTATTQKKNEKGGVVTSTITTKDTGERKQMFGYTARRLIITIENESSPDSCSPMKTKMQTDGWYIDAAFALDCAGFGGGTGGNDNDGGGCTDRYVTKQIGTAKRGFPVYEKMTMFGEDGRETYSFVNEVIELSNTTLDAALFEIPKDYKQVKNTSELYSSMAKQSASAAPSDDSNKNASTLNTTIQNPAAQTGAPQAAELGAKKEGVVRVGLAGVKAAKVGDGVNQAELAGAVQSALGENLKNEQIEVVRLDAREQSEADSEATIKECDYVVYANISHKKGGGGMFGKMLQTVANSPAAQIALTSVTGGIAIAVIQVAAAAKANVKSKDELSLDVKVHQTGAPAAALAKQFKAKAKTDGEDIITPLSQQAAEAIIAAISKS